MFGMVFLHPLHWIVILVALTRIVEALIMMPGIFTNFETFTDYENKIKNFIQQHQL